MQRYEILLNLIEIFKPQSIIEVGTWNGTNAVRMIQQAAKHNHQVSYRGYDLFEEATSETDEREFNVKPHNDISAVRDSIASSTYPADVDLIKGDTNKTLKVGTHADFVFIDGGHSIETIQHDLSCLIGSKVIVLDDYYLPDDEGAMPDISRFGCNKVIDKYPHAVIETQDRVSGGGYVNLAVMFG